MDAAARTLLDAEAISRAERLGMIARSIVEGTMAGEHRSPYRGFAIEFAQHREYAPGDDVRHLDWKVLGRTDRHYIKQYEQETNFAAHLLVDASASMSYGAKGETKFDFARTLAACLAYLILHQRDAVALRIVGGGTVDEVPRSNNRRQLGDVVRHLAAAEPSGETDLARALHDLAGQLRRKGIVVVLSDFLEDEEAVVHAVQHLRFAGHETLGIQILHPDELEFPFSGLVDFEALEPAPNLRTRPSEIREAYLAELAAAKERLRTGFSRSQCHFLETSSADAPAELLGPYLAFRRRTAGPAARS